MYIKVITFVCIFIIHLDKIKYFDGKVNAKQQSDNNFHQFLYNLEVKIL